MMDTTPIFWYIIYNTYLSFLFTHYNPMSEQHTPSPEEMGTLPPTPEVEPTEAEKRAEVQTQIDGLKDMLNDPDLSDEDRAEIEEQIAGLEEAMLEAVTSGRTIYEEIK